VDVPISRICGGGHGEQNFEILNPKLETVSNDRNPKSTNGKVFSALRLFPNLRKSEDFIGFGHFGI
jgi:hypothetical protein